jgi:hypothetical protein
MACSLCAAVDVAWVYAACAGSPGQVRAAARARHNNFLTFINYSLLFLCILYSKSSINPIPILVCFFQGIKGFFVQIYFWEGMGQADALSRFAFRTFFLCPISGVQCML